MSDLPTPTPSELTSAPRDVKLLVVDLLKAHSFATLKSLRLVNREWHALVGPALWSVSSFVARSPEPTGVP